MSAARPAVGRASASYSAPYSAAYSARTVVRAVAVLVAALSVVVGSVLVVTVLQVAHAQSRLEDELNPARVALGTVLTSYVDQETGERGYILTGKPRFLQPYDAAGRRIERNIEVVRSHASPQVLDRVDAMTRAHAAWLREAEHELAAVRAGDRDAAVALVSRGPGKSLFDDLRRAEAAVDEAIAGEQLAATRRADDLLTRLSVLLGLTVLAFLTTAVLAATGFDRTVLRPLSALGAGSRAVAGGRLDDVVSVRGPREVERVAADVDTMRRALLDELDESRRATEALALREPAVAALRAALAVRSVDRPEVSVTGEIASAEGVLAGDFLDVVELDDDRIAVVLGDVSGHGPVAALVALRLKIALATVLGHGGGDAGLDAALPAARATLKDEAETFVTLVVAVLDLRDDTLSYVNAGHPPPFVVGRSGEVTALAPTGPLVSPVLADATWEVATASFAAGDRLVAFSDGVLEARDGDGREFGSDAVLATIGRASDTVEIVRRLRSAVRDHEVHPRDDVTILAATR